MVLIIVGFGTPENKLPETSPIQAPYSRAPTCREKAEIAEITFELNIRDRQMAAKVACICRL